MENDTKEERKRETKNGRENEKQEMKNVIREERKKGRKNENENEKNRKWKLYK